MAGAAAVDVTLDVGERSRYAGAPLGENFVSLGRVARRALLVGPAVLLLHSRAGRAHAILEASQPSERSHVPAGRITLRFRYNSRVDRERSSLVLTRPDHVRQTLPIDPDGPPETLTASATLTPGNYVVRWQVLAVDGHITRGDVAFSVTGP